MFRKLMTQLPIFVAALLLVAAVPAQAGPPDNAEGLWQYIPTIISVEEAGCNQFLTTSEDAIWSGTFNGDSTETGTVIFHCDGHVNFKAVVTFDEVTVSGHTGSLEMSVSGVLPGPANPNWLGHWVILNGTGELENLHGSGTFDGPGYNPADPTAYGQIYYYGKIKFAPGD